MKSVDICRKYLFDYNRENVKLKRLKGVLDQIIDRVSKNSGKIRFSVDMVLLDLPTKRFWINYFGHQVSFSMM